MALIECKECGKEISNQSKACPHCGAPSYESQAGNLFVLLILIMIAAAVFSSNSSDKSNKSSSSSSSSINDEVCFAARSYVQERLKSPSTAKFPMFCNTAIKTGDKTYTYVSYVDSQNSFGAMLRSRFIVSLEHQGGDNFKLLDIKIE